MLKNNLANTLLYVPFNHEYSVSPELQEKLTNEEFFRYCYYKPDFDKLIENIKNMDDEGDIDISYPINTEVLIDNIQEQKEAVNRFFDWIKNNDVGIYCVTGDAGTGKSTFLHHMAYEKFDGTWSFLDLQSAHSPIHLLNYRIEFEKFYYLQQKLSSTVISEIISRIFIRKSEFKYDYINTKQQIENLINYYFDNISELYPEIEIENMFKELSNIDNNSSHKDYCFNAATVFYRFFEIRSKDYLDENKTSNLLMELYLIILRFFNNTEKNIIVFDNLERFVGVDEIYNNQIFEFLQKLRKIFDSYDDTYKKASSNISIFSRNFQFVVAMRHTTTRMFTPQQNSDFIEHSSNVSEWFPIDEIVQKKIDWLKKNGLSTINEDRLIRILSDKSKNGNIIRGLRLKLNALFNNNKRLILDFIAELLCCDKYKEQLALSDEIYSDENLKATLSKHLYRSIIWKLVIDKLLTDDMFVEYLKNYSGAIETHLDYMRRILIILSNYSLEHKYGYMNFEAVLEKLYPKKGENVSEWFCSDVCDADRKQIYSLLYFLNYYCRRDNNWFQFIDIQCNCDSLNGKHINDPDEFYKVLNKNVKPKDINLQITSSGKAYLGYVAHTFEFFASVYDKTNNQILLNIPTENDLLNIKTGDLECMKIITKVTNNSNQMCRRINRGINENYELLYRKEGEPNGIAYSKLIKRSHKGYLNHFIIYIEKKCLISDNKNSISNKKNLLHMIYVYRDKM